MNINTYGNSNTIVLLRCCLLCKSYNGHNCDVRTDIDLVPHPKQLSCEKFKLKWGLKEVE